MNRGSRRVALIAVAAAVAAVAGTVTCWFLSARGTSAPSPPAPVSHADVAARVCLLTSTGTDPSGTWAAMREAARTRDANVVAQRYRLPASANPTAFVNTLVQLRCSTIVATGSAARSAVVSTLAAGHPRGVRFAVVTDRPVPGATRLGPGSVSARSLAELIGGRNRPVT